MLITENPDFPGYDTEGGDPFDSDFLRARAAQSPNDWRCWIRLGYLLENRGDDDAFEALERAVALAPHNGLAHYLLGRACLRFRQYRKGVRELETAVRLRPEHSQSWALLGLVRLERGSPSQALAPLLLAVRMTPSGEAWWQLSRCLMALGRTREAVVTLEEAVRLQSNHTVAHQALALVAAQIGDDELLQVHMSRLTVMDAVMASAMTDRLQAKSSWWRFERRAQVHESFLRRT